MLNGIRAIIFDWNRTLFDKDENKIYPESEKVLLHLYKKGYKLGLISNAESDEIEKREKEIMESGLGKYFLISIKALKNKEHYLNAISKMECNANECVVVDDRVKRGIFIGNKIGCITIWLKKGKFSTQNPESKDEIPKYTIENLEELFNYLY